MLATNLQPDKYYSNYMFHCIYYVPMAIGNMSVTELQRFYLRLKRDVFSRSGFLQKGNSGQLEWYLKQHLKGTMDKISHPKYVFFTVVLNFSSTVIFPES